MRGQIENRFGFAGELYGPVSALVYLRARFYNPVIERFLQEDNVYEDGLNLYAYCRNNPVRYVDPSGHGTESPADKDGGGKKDHSGDVEALEEIVDEVNDKGGATPDEEEIIGEWADEYGVDYDDLGVKKQEDGTSNMGKNNGSVIKNALPNLENATINPKKLTEYALNPEHPVGKNKAKVFESVLGYNQSNASDLPLSGRRWKRALARSWTCI